MIIPFTPKWRAARAARRLAQRRVHAANHWPRLWLLAEGRVLVFIDLACAATARDPAWRYPSEWVRTPEDPGRWAAERINAAGRRGVGAPV